MHFLLRLDKLRKQCNQDRRQSWLICCLKSLNFLCWDNLIHPTIHLVLSLVSNGEPFIITQTSVLYLIFLLFHPHVIETNGLSQDEPSICTQMREATGRIHSWAFIEKLNTETRRQANKADGSTQSCTEMQTKLTRECRCRCRAGEEKVR